MYLLYNVNIIYYLFTEAQKAYDCYDLIMTVILIINYIHVYIELLFYVVNYHEKYLISTIVFILIGFESLL